MRALFKVLSFLPLSVLHALGWCLGWMVFLTSPTYRARFVANARQANQAFGAWWHAVGAAGQVVCELPRLWLGRPVRVSWDGAQHVEAALATGHGILFLTPHLGCFEVTAQAYAARYGAQGRPMTVLFRPPRQPWLRPLVEGSRARPGLETAATTLAGVKQMVRALKRGECVGLLPDQVPPQGLGIWAPFFEKNAYTMTLSVRLALQTGAVVLVAWGERLPWGRGYRVHVRPLERALATQTEVAVRQINTAMEQLVSASPEQYLWGYARYKQPRSETM